MGAVAVAAEGTAPALRAMGGGAGPEAPRASQAGSGRWRRGRRHGPQRGSFGSLGCRGWVGQACCRPWPVGGAAPKHAEARQVEGLQESVVATATALEEATPVSC